jgi:cell wall-active antibiotic response 4TMS protein YvqF
MSGREINPAWVTRPDSLEQEAEVKRLMEFSFTSSTRRRVSLTGPVLLITLGVIFLLDQFVPGCGISRTWPVLLVVFGVIKLLDSTRPPRPPEGPRI